MNRLVFGFIYTLTLMLILGVLVNVPNAQAACSTPPSWQNLGFSDGPRYVTYHLRLINNCSGSNTFRIRVSELPTSPQPLHANWRVEEEDGSLGPEDTMVLRNVSGSENIDVRIIRDVNYYHPDDVYSNVGVRAALNSDPSIDSVISSLVYIVVNRPDLIVSAFRYPGGLTCETTDPILRIKNEGWVAATNNFSVYIDNGRNGTKLETISQTVSHNEVIDLSDRIRNMGLPPPGDWTASAIVDVYDNVNEEVEGNNRENFNYTTTLCNPIGSHDASDCNFSTGWTCDPDDYSQALSVHFYEGGTFLGSTVANTYRPDVPAAGFCKGRAYVGFSFITPEDLKDDNVHNITAYAINIGTGTENPALPGTPKSIRCVPPFEIRGGVFIDTNENEIKDAGESYTGGTLVISGNGTYGTYASGATGFTANVKSGEYSVSYILSSVIDGYESTYPIPIGLTPPTVYVTAGPNCATGTNTHKYSSCDGPHVINVNFGIRVKPADPWINGSGGDMRVDNGLENKIPDGFFFSNISSSPDPVMDPGIVFGTRLDLGGPLAAKSNIYNWFVGNTRYAFPVVKTSYQEMNSILYKGGLLKDAKEIFGGACNGSGPYCSLDTNLNSGVYTSSGDVILNKTSDYNFPSNKNLIFLINGDLKIQNNLIVPKDSTAIFIVNGDIIVDTSVTRIEGVFSANNDFVVEGSRSEYKGIDEQLVIEGAVIANAALKQYSGGSAGTFVNDRDLDRGNDTNPSVKIISRPDFVLHAPSFIRYKSYSIKEVAPGSKPF